MATKPYKYQRQGVKAIKRFGGRALLADEMGLGKTLQILRWWKWLRKRMPKWNRRPLVVVCPASLKYEWQAQAHLHINAPAEVLEGMTPNTDNAMSEHSQIVIVNYEILKAWMTFLKSIHPIAIAIDECHYLGNPKTQRTKNTRRLCQGVPHVIAASGTPLTNRPAELWPTLNIIRPDVWSSFHPYAVKHCQPELGPWGWTFRGATKTKQLNKKLRRTCMIRRRKVDVLKDLPDKIRSVVTLPIERVDEYQHAERDFIGWLMKQNAARAHRAKRAQRMVRMGYLKRLVGELKLQAVVDWTKEFLTSENKLVLFALHTPIIERLSSEFVGRSVTISGKTKNKKRPKLVKQFQTDPRCQLFIGQTKAAGVGLTLTAASHVAIAEFGWTPGEHTQAEDRTHRIGQHNSVNSYWLIGRGTIESKLCRLLQDKQRVLTNVLDTGINVDNLDVFDLLEKELLNG